VVKWGAGLPTIVTTFCVWGRCVNGHGQELIKCPKEREGGRGSTRGGGEKERKGGKCKRKEFR